MRYSDVSKSLLGSFASFAPMGFFICLSSISRLAFADHAWTIRGVSPISVTSIRPILRAGSSIATSFFGAVAMVIVSGAGLGLRSFRQAPADLQQGHWRFRSRTRRRYRAKSAGDG